MAEDDAPMDFYCMTCDLRCEKPLFDVSRGIERVHFYQGNRMPEVETIDSEGVGVYCSVKCRAKGLPALMSAEHVPLPPIPPDIGPIELCARCKGPVYMSTPHITYSQCEVVYEGGAGFVSNFEYLAVVCKKCGADSEEVDTATAEATLAVAAP